MGETATAAPEQAAEEPRRAAVRRLFWQRCEEAGLERPKRVTVEAFGRFRERLVEFLDYLPDPALVALADTVIRIAGAKAEWPAESVIRSQAQALRPEPPARAPIIRSWLRSVEGPIAREGGYLTELYTWLLRTPLPPTRGWELPRIQQEAEWNRRERARLRALVAEGRASQQQLDWLSGYEAAERAALDLVAEGEAKRAGEP